MTEAVRFGEVLRARAAEEGLTLSVEEASLLGEHYVAMVRYNRAHNLTRITERDAAIEAHYLDALRGLGRLGLPRAGARVLDVGSGAGFPGVVAAVRWPTADVTLAEPARKRASFLRSFGQRHGPLFAVEQRRVDEVSGHWDVVLSRATFSWENGRDGFATMLELLGEGGVLACWVGSAPCAEEWRAFTHAKGAVGTRHEGVGKGALCTARR